MAISIRKFLLINLLLAITITTTITIIGNYYLDKQDIQRHLDTLMSVSTLSYQALLSDDVDESRVKQVQQSLSNIRGSLIYLQRHGILTEEQVEYAKQFKLQVWSDKGELLLHSENAPAIPLSSGKEGFSDEIVDGEMWRVFTAYNASAGITTMVGEQYDTRDKLGHILARDDVYIMLLTFPLSGFLIWVIIGRGLASLVRVAKEVSDRAPAYLEPVDLVGVPVEIKPVVDELNKLFIRLQQAFEREKRFAGDAAHELRTPLAALKTQAQVALKTIDSLEREEALKNVVAGVDRSSHIVQQLLTMSRLVPEANYVTETTDVNIAQLAREVIAHLAPAAIAKQIDLELINDGDVIINGNTTTLGILIRNLVDNAVRYTPPHGNVQVSIIDEPEFVILRVRDNGPGIPAELRNRVFERFFRILGNQAPGSGLGLAIVAQIAALHNAEIQVGTPPVGTGLEIEAKFHKK